MEFSFDLTGADQRLVDEALASGKPDFVLVPCGPPYPHCEDNSYACDCEPKERQE